jgi:hypothetical protein
MEATMATPSRQAIDRGIRARAAGRPITANPFELDTPSWHGWRMGWNRQSRVQRRAPASPVRVEDRR